MGVIYIVPHVECVPAAAGNRESRSRIVVAKSDARVRPYPNIDDAVVGVSAAGSVGHGESGRAFDILGVYGEIAAAASHSIDLGGVNVGGVAAGDRIAPVRNIVQSIDHAVTVLGYHQTRRPVEHDL